MQRLNNKVAIVTGGARGIGAAISKRFAAEGAKVAILSRNKTRIDDCVKAIADAGGEALGIVCDITQPEAITSAVAEVVAALGTVDILVNNAMDVTTTEGTALDTKLERINHQMQGGPYAHLLFMQACYPYMKGRGGRVINLASSVGFIGKEGYLPYAIAKEGVRALTRVAAREWGADDITVNCVCPVAMSDSFDTAVADGEWNAADFLPIPRIGNSEKDIAPVIAFLASEDAAYMTGYSLMADGGFMMDAAR